jgi:hypothetical protein
MGFFFMAMAFAEGGGRAGVLADTYEKQPAYAP